VWVKTTSSGFLLAKKMPMRKHEMIYVFYRKIPLYDLSSHSHKFLNSMSGMSNAKTNICYGDAPISVRNKQYDPPLPNSILEVKSQKGKHSTQKPTELMKWILKYYSKEGDTVLDPTMGSGSTGVACKEMNRKFIGIEKDEMIFKSAVERLNKN
jgi:site-specific DNA-methyltransferase (adenine-specific)